MRSRRQLVRTILIILTYVFAIGVLLVSINWFSDQDNLAKNGEQDFKTLPQSGMKDGIYVTGSIDKAIGPYANVYTADNEGNRKSDVSSDDYCYLVPVYSQTGFIDHFVSFKAESSADKEAMDKIVQSTADGTEAQPLNIEHGRMVNLDYQQENILKTWAADDTSGESFVDYCAANNLMGTSDKDLILSKIITYSIDRTDSAGISFIYLLIAGVPCLTFIMILIIMRIKDKARKKKEAEQEEFGIGQPL